MRRWQTHWPSGAYCHELGDRKRVVHVSIKRRTSFVETVWLEPHPIFAMRALFLVAGGARAAGGVACYVSVAGSAMSELRL